MHRVTALLRHPLFVGNVWRLLGAALIAGTVFLFFGLAKALGLVLDDSNVSIAIVAIVAVGASLAELLLGRWLFKRGKKVLAIWQASRALRDQRPPVVYLRSFQDDTRGAVTPDASGLQMMVGSSTEEEQLAAAFNEIGPFIGIGRPGETLPELGAARFYVNHDAWQDRVRELVAAAQLVVFRVGKTPGFFWEVQHAAGAIPPEKLVLLLPYKTGEYELFRQKARSIFPVELPQFTGGPTLAGSFLGGVLYFARDWTPHILKLRVPFHMTTLGRILNPGAYIMNGLRIGRPFKSIIKRTLYPVLENNGLRWRWPARHPLLYVENWLMIATWGLVVRTCLGGR